MPATLTFNDDFNSLSLWNGASGTWSTTTAYVDPMGNGSSIPGNGEQQWYVNANYGPTALVHPWTAANGVLTLSAQKVDPSVAAYLGYNQAGLPAMGSYEYTSGLIETNHSFTQTYGYFEMRAELPSGQGLWPAFWLMRADGAWPPELDVMEALGKDTTTAYAAVHTAQSGAHTSIGQAANLGDISSGYHTYAVDWEADKITFFYDNRQVMQVDTPADMHSPMYMIANLAIGGDWAGRADGSTPFPAQMKIDYIRAWDSNPNLDGAKSSAAPAAPSQDVTGNGLLQAPDTGGRMIAGAGADTVIGGANGANYLRGGEGADSIAGGWTFDDINGNQGDDIARGGGGDDWVVGGQGHDMLSGELGGDVVLGNLGNDTLQGNEGADILRGGQGDDLLLGGDGSDWLSGDRGSDTVSGGAGSDVFHTFSGAGVSVVTDFSPWEGDRVQVDPGDSYAVTQQGDAVVVDMAGGGEVILQHTQLSSLPDGWIFGA